MNESPLAIAGRNLAPVLPSDIPPAALQSAPVTAAAPFDSRDAAAERAREIGGMASGLAHDFRNLLAVIASSLRLAERRLAPGNEAIPFLDAAHASVERGVLLASRLLALARPAPAEAEPEQVAGLIEALVPFLRYAVGPRIALGLQVDPGSPDSRVPPSGFNAVLLNLVVNARDAMPGGGEIRLVVTGETDATGASWLKVSVTDNGEGMEEAVRMRMFEPWFTTKAERGTGLGLPQVRVFMARCGGRTEVESRVGEGTAFHLFFPVYPEDSQGMGSGR